MRAKGWTGKYVYGEMPSQQRTGKQNKRDAEQAGK